MVEVSVPRMYRHLPRLVWYINNPLLPDGEVEATFCFRFPFPTKWRARLERLEYGRRTARSLPVAFTLQYLTVPENYNEIHAYLSVNISNFAGLRDAPRVPHSFVEGNHHTYRITASIRPNDCDIAIVVYIALQGPSQNLGEFNFDIGAYDYDGIELDLSVDLRRLLSRPLYFDIWLQSTDPGHSHSVHSIILGSRWSQFVAQPYEYWDQPNQNNPPTLVTDISPAVLSDILTYLYTGRIDHFNWFNRPPDDDYKTELLQVMDNYPLQHLHMILHPEGNTHKRNTRFLVCRKYLTVDIQPLVISPTYRWQHIPFEDHNVDISLKFYVPPDNDPSFSYSLKFTNPIELFVRVSLEYRRQVGLEPKKKELVYDRYWQVPRNGEVSPMPEIPMQGDIASLREFVAGGDRMERGQEVGHTFRFILFLSSWFNCTEITQYTDEFQHEFESQEESFVVLSHHMSVMRYRMQDKADLHVSVVDPVTGNTVETYHLHKAIFEIRVPNWRNVIQQDVPAESNLPDNVACTTINNVFQIVVDYIYTGRCMGATPDLYDAVRNFAVQSGLGTLHLKVEELSRLQRLGEEMEQFRLQFRG